MVGYTGSQPAGVRWNNDSRGSLWRILMNGIRNSEHDIYCYNTCTVFMNNKAAGVTCIGQLAQLQNNYEGIF